MTNGSPSRLAENFDPGRITQCFGVMNLAGSDRDAVADLENEALAARATSREPGRTL